MITELPSINKHFHANATRYQGGDIVFLIDGSDANRAAYGEHDAAIHVAVESAAVVKEKWNGKTRAFFYGGMAPIEIDLKNPAIVEDPCHLAPGGKDTALAPTIEMLKKEYPDSTPEHPLHVIVITSGRNSDKFSELREGMKSWLEEPGKQVLLDFILTTRNYAELTRIAGPVGSLMMDGGKSINPDKPAPFIEQAFDLQQLPRKIGDVINNRITPDNPHQFLLNIVVETVAKGAPAGTLCPLKAEFKKKPRTGR